MVKTANDLWEERRVDARNPLSVMEGDAPLPLIRLRVDYTGDFETSNPVRFGQQYSGKVANPNDLLVFYRKRQSKE